MTNEELCTEIQNGHDEYISQLWDQVYKFISMRADKYLCYYPDNYASLKEDMINESYFQFLKAVDHYDQSQGSFINFLSHYLNNAFKVALVGGRTDKVQRDPLNNYIGFDAPVTDTEDLTIADTLPDNTSEACYRRLEDEDFWRSVSGLLGDVISQVKDETGRELVRYMYNHNCSIKEASQALYGAAPVPYEHYRKALKEIRMLMKYSAVKKRVELIGLDDYISYTGTGLNAYKNRCFTSSVEAAAVKRADADFKTSDIMQILT